MSEGRGFDLKKFLISILRRASYKYPYRKDVLATARVERGKYKCADCEEIVGPKEFDVDHIEPIIPIEGWISWDDYIMRLYCAPEKMQVLCRPCHKSKTYLENQLRKEFKNARAWEE